MLLLLFRVQAGHAAHFANIQQPSPLFSQERAPTSVAYAENQSMFLDSLVGDAAWRAKYAKDLNGKSIPFDIIVEEIKSTHPFAVFQLRAMLSVSYFEKALYELPESEVNVEIIQSLADEIEKKIQGGLSPRPLLSVPHLVSDEASCYYQGYTLAEMSVYQTREHFKVRRRRADNFVLFYLADGFITCRHRTNMPTSTFSCLPFYFLLSRINMGTSSITPASALTSRLPIGCMGTLVNSWIL